jgi:hypothetical protein
VKDPNRLSHEGSLFEAKLLRSARGDIMPERSWRVILAGLGVAPSLTAASTAAAAGAKVLTVKSAIVIASLGTAGALAVWGGASLSEPTPAPPSPPVVVQAPVVAPKVVERQEPRVVAPEPAQEEAPKEEPVRVAKRAVQKKVDTLPLELKAIDDARGALARGDHALASRLLDRYHAQFPKPRLGAEATMLRIETLVARGDRAGAARLGTAFLKRAPNSPYARRVRSLIGEGAGEP